LQTIVWYGNDDNKPMYKRETGGRSAAPAFRYFYTNWLESHPEIQRKFTIPKDVFVQEYNNKKEVFTKTSNIPQNETQLEIQTDYLENKNILF
jgi:penicillin-binding protein 1A